MEPIRADEGEILDIELEEDFLRRNREQAEKNRELLRHHGVRAVDVMGSVGSGKTTLIGHMVEQLKSRSRVAVIAGDVTTSIDADRLAQKGVEVIQVNTGKECHLDAPLVARALARLPLDELDTVFIENVGNLICPAEFPLGAGARLVVVSVTEGPWMVVKHPYIFQEAQIVVVNKRDLSELMGVSLVDLERDIHGIREDLKMVATNGLTGEGVEELVAHLNLTPRSASAGR